MEKSNTRAIILAAGKSSRFKTGKSKLLYSVCGQAMILYPVKLLKAFNIPITIVVGHQANEIQKLIDKENFEDTKYVTQKQRLGTAHAVKESEKTWDKDNILILNGDTPLLTEEMIKSLIEKHIKNESQISFLAAHSLSPFGYGRVVKKDGNISIVEERSCTEDQRSITFINSGIYLVTKKFLIENIDKIEPNPISGEFYITDLVNIASQQKVNVQAISVPYDYIRGVNTLEELWAAEQIKRSETMKYWMARGVRFELAQSIHLDFNVKIGAGSFIGTGVHLIGNTSIGKNCTINAFSIIENTTIKDNTHIHSHSIVQNSTIGYKVHIGPFARVRNFTTLKDNVNIGNFVEIKNSSIKEGTKTKHLSFIGDAKIGKNVIIGAGTITCNDDGTKKNTTIIEDDVFIGSNNTLIAPLKIGSKTHSKGGSIINKNVPEGSIIIGKVKQETKNKNLKNDIQNLNINFIGATKAKGPQENL